MEGGKSLVQLPSLDHYRVAKSMWKALRNHDTMLVRGMWMVKQARQGAVLQRRQEVALEAFWPFDSLFTLDGKMTKRVAAISYAWLTNLHPDPEGKFLQIMGRVLQYVVGAFGDSAIFFDWCSLFQESRTPEQLASFKRSLHWILIWYVHADVIKLLFTSSPPGVDIRPYSERGWPTFEVALSKLITPPELVLDLGLYDEKLCLDFESTCKFCKAPQEPPLNIQGFASELKTKAFTVPEDYGFLERKYSDAFMAWIGGVEELTASNLGWGDEDAAKFCSAIQHCCKLSKVNIAGNKITDTSVAKVSLALSRCSKLIELDLMGNPISTHGERKLVKAWVRAKKPMGGLMLNGMPSGGESGEAKSASSAEEQEPESKFLYVGTFMNRQRAGRGCLHCPQNGYKYEGEFKEDHFHGSGELTLPDGSRYEGEWVRGQKHGCGLFISPDGLTYSGQWQNGMREGNGTQEYPNGGVYEGQWLQGLCDGRGTYHNPDGTYFTGGWVKGVHHGVGWLHSDAKGTCERQLFETGVLMQREIMPVIKQGKEGPRRRGWHEMRPVGKQSRDGMMDAIALPKMPPSKHLIRREVLDMDVTAPPLRLRTPRTPRTYTWKITRGLSGLETLKGSSECLNA